MTVEHNHRASFDEALDERAEPMVAVAITTVAPTARHRAASRLEPTL